MRTQLVYLGLALGLAVSHGATGCAANDAPAIPDPNDGDGEGEGDQDAGDDTTPPNRMDGGAVKNDGGDASNGKADAGGKTDGGGSTANPDGGGKADGGKVDGGTSGGPSDGGATIILADGAVVPDPYPHPNGYVNLAITAGTAFDKTKGDTHPMANYTPPAGWNYYKVDGASCRNGSEFGVMAHWSTTGDKSLFIYFEGGGACANPGFCNLNPVDINHEFNGKGQVAILSTSLVNTPQDPGKDGIFNLTEATNPYKDWNFVYIPYCTGDVHFGANPTGKIEGLDGNQNFSGAANTKAVIARTMATWPDTTRFIAGGSSAGGYGAGLNYGMIQDSFANAEGSALLDASPPFSNTYAPVCLQKRWREAWNLDANIPSDCGEQCKSSDGGNLFQIVDYWRGKYPKAHIGLISGIHDEIIRLFFALGNNNCADYQTDDPVVSFISTVGQTYDPAMFEAGLLDLRTRYVSTGQLATYYEDGLVNATIHQCLFDPRLYQEAAGAGKGTIADFLTKFTNDQMTQVGP